MAVPAASNGVGEGAVVIRVFGEITVQSASEGRKRVLWAEDSKDGERGEGAEEKTEESGGAEKRGCGCHRSTCRGLSRTPLQKRPWLKSHGASGALPCVVPWACSSSLLSSSECGWLLPLVTVLARLLDRTPAPERSITEGMAATNTRTTCSFMMLNHTFHLTR